MTLHTENSNLGEGALTIHTPLQLNSSNMNWDDLVHFLVNCVTQSFITQKTATLWQKTYGFNPTCLKLLND